ncbi:unnamed protein product [Chilo suppressalis]|uniref:Uncharacterized protein n=1 Tax=Chilo suppressalis TaxID=168631 RepID=A0ABN8L6G5_CHISP|nr:unnamed protein product [Chilo suppressalis]
MDNKLCRLCCINSGNSNIFHTDSCGILLSDKIMYCCANIKLTEDDGLPTCICKLCEQELATAYQFILKCEATDKSLRSTINVCANLKPDLNNDCETKLEIKAEEPNSDCDFPCNYESNDDLDIPLAAFYKNIKAEANNSNSAVVNKNKSHTKKVKKRQRYKEPVPTNCSICDRKCQNPSTLVAHMRSHTDEKPYQCVSCNKCYKDPGSLKRHTERNHLKQRERKFICETCGKGFYSKTDYVTHMRSHTGETPYTCSECPSRFTQLSSLIRHRTKHSGEKSQVCPTCSKRFSTKDQLNTHLKVHTDIKKQFPCSICNVLFKYKNNLNKHMKMHTNPSRFVCNYCGRMFNLKGNLKIHIDRVHSEKSGVCNVCSKIVSNIEVHMWRHTGQRPLKCEYCTSSFYELKALAHHMNFRHKYADKYKCTIEGCFRTFPSQPMLDFHIAKIHESNIKFPCDKCSRGFYRKNDLARHKIGTHKEKLN